jgi:hypothetical protein
MINDNLLLEMKLSRVLTKINKDNNAICVISAFRNETQEKNIQRNTELAKFVRSENFGFVYVDGGWIENAGTEQEKEVTEVSLFIETTEQNEERLFSFAVNMAKKFNQDAFVFKSPKHPFGLYNKEGGLDVTFDKVKFNDFKEYFSKIKFGSHSNRKYVFEGLRIPDATSYGSAIMRDTFSK